MSRLDTLAVRATSAVLHAPALAQRLKDAGLAPADLARPGALDQLPVLAKTRLMALQAIDPPFAGYLGVPPKDVAHVYASPGPIFEPVLKGHEAHGFDRMFHASGLGPGDVALNTWSYHLVPAGLVFDAAARATGATIVPSGPGQTELQVELIARLGVTAFLGSTAYFETVAAAYAVAHGKTSGHWPLRHAFLGGEPGDWMAKRRRLEDAYGIRTHGCYGTADLGLVGYEDTGAGYLCHEDRLVQICDPATDEPLPVGIPGQVVVTTLSPGWPMIRFGTGDLARALELGSDGFTTRMSGIEGRVGDGVKVREIFLYASQVARLAADLGPGVTGCIRITRQSGRDHIALDLSGPPCADETVTETFRRITRLHPDRVRWLETLTQTHPLEDARDF